MNHVHHLTYLNEFLNHLRVQEGLSHNTIISYKAQLKGYLLYLEGLDCNVLEVGLSDIQGFLEFKMEKGCKSSTRFISAISIKRFHQFLTYQKKCENNPAISLTLPKYKQTVPDPLSVEEIEALINHANGNRFSLIRMRAMLECLYTTGLRVSELINLKFAQIDLAQNWIRVLGKGNKIRYVPFGPKAKEALKNYFGERNKRFGIEKEMVFLNNRGSQITRGGFWKQLRNLGRSASIMGRVHPHRIRHTTACHLLSNGANLKVIQELYGHSSVTSTQRYAQVTPNFLKSSIEAAHPRF